MPKQIFDTIIIGAGPAGMAAAIYLARQKLDFIVITKDVGGQTRLSSEVGNYLGFHLMPGADLVKMFKEHLADYDVKIQEGEEVKKVEKMNGGFKVISDKDEYQTKTLLIATGEKYRKLKVPGEKEFYGKGVTYCATCDAPLFKGKDVAVVGGGNSAMEAALFAGKYANKVYILSINPELEGEALLIDRVNKDKKIEFISNAKTTEIIGNKFVTGLHYGQDGQSKELKVQGVFIEIGLIPVSDFIDFVEKDEWGEIMVDKNNRTSVEGIWAAGDVTDITEKQIAVAVGEGSKASIRMIKYIEKHQ
jgi:alkyl hydroperoxide reductase subunit F